LQKKETSEANRAEETTSYPKCTGKHREGDVGEGLGRKSPDNTQNFASTSHSEEVCKKNSKKKHALKPNPSSSFHSEGGGFTKKSSGGKGGKGEKRRTGGGGGKLQDGK